MAHSKLAVITFLSDGEGEIDNSLPSWLGGITGRPDNSLPSGGGRPDQSLPLPVFPFDPTKPDDSLPDNSRPKPWPPRPGDKFIVKYLACKGLILVPDNSLPGSGGSAGNELPETPEPK